MIQSAFIRTAGVSPRNHGADVSSPLQHSSAPPRVPKHEIEPAPALCVRDCAAPPHGCRAPDAFALSDSFAFENAAVEDWSALGEWIDSLPDARDAESIARDAKHVAAERDEGPIPNAPHVWAPAQPEPRVHPAPPLSVVSAEELAAVEEEIAHFRERGSSGRARVPVGDQRVAVGQFSIMLTLVSDSLKTQGDSDWPGLSVEKVAGALKATVSQVHGRLAPLLRFPEVMSQSRDHRRYLLLQPEFAAKVARAAMMLGKTRKKLQAVKADDATVYGRAPRPKRLLRVKQDRVRSG